MQSQLDNAYARCKNSMITNIDAITMAATWRPHSIGPIELLSGKIVDDYSL